MSAHPKEREYPLILIAVAVAIYVLAAFVNAGASGVGATLVMLSIAAVIQTVILIIAGLLVGSLLSVSFGEVPSAALKFAATALASGAVSVLIPGGGFVALFVFLGLIMWLFEIELPYAIVLTIIYFVISFSVALVLSNIAK